LACLRRTEAGTSLADELDVMSRRFAGLEVRDSRPADEILGYDENGLPA
jgi:hypothetical protein